MTKITTLTLAASIAVLSATFVSPASASTIRYKWQTAAMSPAMAEAINTIVVEGMKMKKAHRSRN